MITSFNQYLDEAMDLNTFRYIQKPLDVLRLFSGLSKAIERFQQATVQFYLSKKNETVRVFSDDIIYIEIVKRHTQVVTIENSYISDHSLSYWQSRLPSTSFYMVHSSFIVNVRFITKYTRDMLVLDHKYSVPVAYRKQSAFKRYFFEYSKNSL